MRGSGRCGFPWTARAWMRCRPRARRPRPVRRPRRPLPPRWLRDECGAGRDGCRWRTRRSAMAAGQAVLWRLAKQAGGGRHGEVQLADAGQAMHQPRVGEALAVAQPVAGGLELPGQELRARSLGWPPVHGTDASSHAGTCGWTRRIMRVLRSGQQAGFQLGGSRRWNGWNRSGGYGPDPPWRDHGRPRGCARRRPRPRARNGLVRARRPALTRHFQRHVEQPGAVGLARIQASSAATRSAPRPRPPPW